MNNPEYPLERTGGHVAESHLAEELSTPKYRYVDTSTMEFASAPGFDSFLEYWRILRRYKKTLLRFAAAGLLAAIAISMLQTPTYRVRTSIEIQGADLQDGKNSGGMSGGFSTPESYVDTQVKLLQSESLIEDVIDKLDLHRLRPTGWRAWMPTAQNILSLVKRSKTPEKDQLIRQVQDNLTVRTSGDTRLVEVMYESPDPRQSAGLANMLVSEFIRLSQDARWASAQGTVEWLSTQLNQMKAQLEQSEERLQDYALTSGLSYASEKDNLEEDRLKQLQDDLTRAQTDRIVLQARLEQAKSQPADSLPEILEDPNLREYREKLSELQQQHAELSATLTPEHYKVQRVNAQIAELKADMVKERGNVLGRIGNEYNAAARREKLLSNAHDQQEKVVAKQTTLSIHYDTLQRDVDSNRRLYEAMLLKVKEASVTAAMRENNALVIDHAKPPFLPYSPNLPVNLVIGLASGIILGFGFVMVRERVDRRIVAPGEAQVYLDLPELGVMPLDETRLYLPAIEGRRLKSPLPPLPIGSAADSSMADCPELATWQRKPSLLAECTRTTLTSILLPSRNGEDPHVIVLTSPCPGDGKTTVACNLSIAVAEIGRKVLLMDGDLRRPRLHKVFGISNDRGLSDLLWEESPLEELAIEQMVTETEISGLYVMPGGGHGATPSNLLYSPRMTELLKRLSREFAMILIDAPPLIHLADARVLGRMSDGVVLVIRAGETTAESAQFARQRFVEDGTRVLGFVLNKWDPKNIPLYDYGGSTNHYAGRGE